MIYKTCEKGEMGENSIDLPPMTGCILYVCIMLCDIFNVVIAIIKTLLMTSISPFETKINSALFYEKCQFNKDPIGENNGD